MRIVDLFFCVMVFLIVFTVVGFLLSQFAAARFIASCVMAWLVVFVLIDFAGFAPFKRERKIK